MTKSDRPRPWEELGQLLETGEASPVVAFLGSLEPHEMARTLLRLDGEQQARLLRTVDPSEAADLVEQIPESEAIELMEQVSPEDAAAIIEELPSDERADLLGGLSSPEAEAILSAMHPQEAAEARKLTAYPAHVAGGLMVTEYLSYPQDWTVSNVVEDLREMADRYRDYDVQYAYVKLPKGTLSGVLRLRDLLLAPRETPLRKIMIKDPLTVADTAELEELTDLFDRHHFVGVPVVDSKHRLVGVVRAVDLEAALGERADSDYRKSLGIVGGEELRSMPVLLRSRRRLSWLSVNILLNIIAASVIVMYQDTLTAIIALAAFLPIISDMSGCSGNQAVAVSMRELSLGLVRPRETIHVWLREISVGVINGLALGLLLGTVAMVWKGDPLLGGVVAAAMALNTMIAVSIGGVVPLMLRRMGKDPALASGPILTTVTDMCGFFILLSLATLLLTPAAGS
jgi:magnesium transporter